MGCDTVGSFLPKSPAKEDQKEQFCNKHQQATQQALCASVKAAMCQTVEKCNHYF